MRWALLLAIDIADYEGMAVDGAGTLSPVHIPSLGAYPELYIAPMESWLSDFTLDLGNCETFKPYDPDAPQRVVEYARGRGYVVPDDPAAQDQAFGLGWYKYDPDAASKLLEKNGFKKNAAGQFPNEQKLPTLKAAKYREKTAAVFLKRSRLPVSPTQSFWSSATAPD